MAHANPNRHFPFTTSEAATFRLSLRTGSRGRTETDREPRTGHDGFGRAAPGERPHSVRRARVERRRDAASRPMKSASLQESPCPGCRETPSVLGAWPHKELRSLQNALEPLPPLSKPGPDRQPASRLPARDRRPSKRRPASPTSATELGSGTATMLSITSSWPPMSTTSMTA